MLNDAGRARRPVVSVLGGSGFLGSAIIQALAPHRVHIRAASRRPTTVTLPTAQTAATLTPLSADLTDRKALARAIHAADAVIVAVARIAGQQTWRVSDDDSDSARVNQGIATTVAEMCAEGQFTGSPPIVLFAGSTSQAGHHPGPLTGAEPDHPVTAYDRQKLAAERALLEATRAGHCRAASLRLPTVFGPAAATSCQDKGIVSAMARRALAGQALTLWNDGSVVRDLLYVTDAAAAFVAALAAADRLSGRAWVVGSGQRVQLRELFAAIADDVAALSGGHRVEVRQVPPPPYASPLDLRSVQLDPAAFTAATGWSARVGWRDAVRRTVAALVSQQHHRQPIGGAA